MEEMRQMQMDTRAASYTVLVSKKGKVTIKKKMRKEPVKMVSMSITARSSMCWKREQQCHFSQILA